MTTGKTIALTRQTFVGKVMSLLFNMLSRLVITFLPRRKRLLKNIYFCFIDSVKAFDCVDHNKLWKILQKMGIPDHLTCLLRNLYVGQEAIVSTGRGTTGWFQIGKGVYQGCMLSPWLFKLYAKYIMKNAGLNKSQFGIKIAGRNINNLRCADDNHSKWQKVKRN